MTVHKDYQIILCICRHCDYGDYENDNQTNNDNDFDFADYDDNLTYPSPTKRPSQCPDEQLFLEGTLEPPVNQGRW